MRCDDHVRIAEQRVVGDGLGGEHVERRAADLARVEPGLEVGVDDQRPAGDVQDPHAVLALGERRRVEPALRVWRVRQVQRDEVGGRVHVVRRRRLLDPQLPVALGRDVRIERDHVHPERPGPLSHELPDLPEAEDPERLLVQLDAGELRPLPLAADQRRVGLRHVARERQQQRHRVLGRGDHVRLRRVGDDDPALGGGVDIDVVHPDAGPANGPEPAGPRDQRRVELRRRPDQNPVVFADPLLELLARPPDPELDVEVRRAAARCPSRRSSPPREPGPAHPDPRPARVPPAPTRSRSQPPLQHPVDAGGQGLHVAWIGRREHSRPAAGCARACGTARRRRSRWRAAWTPGRPRPPRSRSRSSRRPASAWRDR